MGFFPIRSFVMQENLILRIFFCRRKILRKNRILGFFEPKLKMRKKNFAARLKEAIYKKIHVRIHPILRKNCILRVFFLDIVKCVNFFV